MGLANHKLKKVDRVKRRRALPISRQPQELKEIKCLTTELHGRLQLLTHLVAFFANRLNKHLIANSLSIYSDRRKRLTEHSPAKDLEALSRHAAELLDVYEDILYHQDHSQS